MSSPRSVVAAPADAVVAAFRDGAGLVGGLGQVGHRHLAFFDGLGVGAGLLAQPLDDRRRLRPGCGQFTVALRRHRRPVVEVGRSLGQTAHELQVVDQLGVGRLELGGVVAQVLLVGAHIVAALFGHGGGVERGQLGRGGVLERGDEGAVLAGAGQILFFDDAELLAGVDVALEGCVQVGHLRLVVLNEGQRRAVVFGEALLVAVEGVLAGELVPGSGHLGQLLVVKEGQLVEDGRQPGGGGLGPLVDGLHGQVERAEGLDRVEDAPRRHHLQGVVHVDRQGRGFLARALQGDLHLADAGPHRADGADVGRFVQAAVQEGAGLLALGVVDPAVELVDLDLHAPDDVDGVGREEGSQAGVGVQLAQQGAGGGDADLQFLEAADEAARIVGVERAEGLALEVGLHPIELGAQPDQGVEGLGEFGPGVVEAVDLENPLQAGDVAQRLGRLDRRLLDGREGAVDDFGRLGGGRGEVLQDATALARPGLDDLDHPGEVAAQEADRGHQVEAALERPDLPVDGLDGIAERLAHDLAVEELVQAGVGQQLPDPGLLQFEGVDDGGGGGADAVGAERVGGVTGGDRDLPLQPGVVDGGVLQPQFQLTQVLGQAADGADGHGEALAAAHDARQLLLLLGRGLGALRHALEVAGVDAVELDVGVGQGREELGGVADGAPEGLGHTAGLAGGVPAVAAVLEAAVGFQQVDAVGQLLDVGGEGPHALELLGGDDLAAGHLLQFAAVVVGHAIEDQDQVHRLAVEVGQDVDSLTGGLQLADAADDVAQGGLDVLRLRLHAQDVGLEGFGAGGVVARFEDELGAQFA